jgi:hypothetical protein
VVVYVGHLDAAPIADWGGLDPDTCTRFTQAANEMGMDGGRLLEQVMCSFLARRNAPVNKW